MERHHLLKLHQLRLRLKQDQLQQQARALVQRTTLSLKRLKTLALAPLMATKLQPQHLPSQTWALACPECLPTWVTWATWATWWTIQWSKKWWTTQKWWEWPNRWWAAEALLILLLCKTWCRIQACKRCLTTQSSFKTRSTCLSHQWHVHKSSRWQGKLIWIQTRSLNAWSGSSQQAWHTRKWRMSSLIQLSSMDYLCSL